MNNTDQKGERPKCRMCGKTLVKHWYETEWATEHYGREPTEVNPTTYDPGRTIGFYGHYGKDGKGFFCSYKCGWKWAVYTSQQEKGIK